MSPRFGDLHDVILVGHSYGGAVITAVSAFFPSKEKPMLTANIDLSERAASLVSDGYDVALVRKRDEAREGLLFSPLSSKAASLLRADCVEKLALAAMTAP